MQEKIRYSKPSEQGKNHTFWTLSDQWWLGETLAWLISILLLVAIVIILAVYNGQPTPTLHWGITERSDRYSHQDRDVLPGRSIVSLDRSVEMEPC